MIKIKRRCKCGCGNITNCGRKWIRGHGWTGKKFSEEHKKNLSIAHKGKKLSKKCKLNMSLARQNVSKKTKRKISLALKGHKHSEKTKRKISLTKIKYDPSYEYCDIWKDKEYRKDLRKDYCENIDCKKISKKLNNHHIYLNKKRCAPKDIMTLCNSCHITLHRSLQENRYKYKANPKDYIIINRPGHISYIHKKAREIVKIKRHRYDPNKT